MGNGNPGAFSSLKMLFSLTNHSLDEESERSCRLFRSLRGGLLLSLDTLFLLLYSSLDEQLWSESELFLLLRLRSPPDDCELCLFLRLLALVSPLFELDLDCEELLSPELESDEESELDPESDSESFWAPCA